MIKIVNIKKVGWDVIDVYIGRSNRGKGNMDNIEVGRKGWLGNKYGLDKYSREESIYLFSIDFLKRLRDDEEFRNEVMNISGIIGCWCKPDLCHGDMIKLMVQRLNEVEDVDGYIKLSLEKLLKEDSKWLSNLLSRS